MRCMACIGIMFLLAACASIQSSQVPDQINAMNGLSKEQVLSCMGPPTTKSSEGVTEAWTYSSFGAVTTNASLSGNRYGAFGSSTTSQDSCIVNLTMRDGAVAAANYRSQGRLMAPSLPCYNVLSICTAGRIGVNDAIAKNTRDATQFCKELYADERLNPIRGTVALDEPPTLSQQNDPTFIKDTQRPALDVLKELVERCRKEMAKANPQMWKILVQVQPAPQENLILLYRKKITIGEFNKRKQDTLEKLQAAIASRS
jgi:hypothetical protein